MRALVKHFLQRLGLFQSVYEVLTYLRSIKFIGSNLKYYLRGTPDKLPVPPLSYIALVTGKPDADLFFRTGRSAAENIRESLWAQHLRIEDFRSILDFGCGCGRVLRHWRNLSATRIHGVDYNRDLARWCAKNLPFVIARTNDLRPPLDFGDHSFDFIYALSVFTHLTEDLQNAWISELTRVLRPGGILLISTHGEYYLDQLNEEEKTRFIAGDFVVKGDGRVGSNWLGAYHPKEYVIRKLTKGLNLLNFVSKGATGNPFQDLYLFKKV